MRWHAGVALTLTLGGFESPSPVPPVEIAFANARARMVREQIMARGVTDGRVLAALSRVPRHEFVPVPLRPRAYEDGPLPIGHGQTISQPYVVAFMTEALAPKPGDRVLEIGTGSGYQAAVLAGLVAEVFSIEIVAALARRAETDLRRTGCANVQVRAGNGYLGWPEAAPFDAIIVTCAPEAVPPALVDQLKVGGRMIIPVGPQDGHQELYLLRKRQQGLETQAVLPVRFVPMVGKAGG
jgi:protein-L-isoaspartate(D-aspartate) O-methyltransferase